MQNLPHTNESESLDLQLVAIARRQQQAIREKARPAKGAFGRAGRAKETPAYTKRGDAMAARSQGRHAAFVAALGRAVLRPRGSKARDAFTFQRTRAAQVLTEEEKGELHAAIFSELSGQRTRTARGMKFLRRMGLTLKWVRQYRIKAKVREISGACRSGRRALNYGFKGEKADSILFRMTPLDESIRHESRDRSFDLGKAKRHLVARLAAYHAPRRGGKAWFKKDAEMLSRTLELIVTSQDKADLFNGLGFNSIHALGMAKNRLGKRIAEGDARLASKKGRTLKAAPYTPPARALIEVSSTRGEVDARNRAIAWTRALPYVDSLLDARRADAGELSSLAGHFAHAHA